MNWTIFFNILIAIIGATTGYLAKYFFDRKSELAIRHAENKRSTYDKLLKILLNTMNGKTNQDKLKIDTTDIYKTLSLYASPKVLIAYGNLMQNIFANKDTTQPENTKDFMLYFSKLLKAIRRDLGLKNHFLGKEGRLLLRPRFNDYGKYFKENIGPR